MANLSNASVPSMVGVYVFVYCLLEGLQRVSGFLFLATMDLLGLRRMPASLPFLLSRATANFAGVLLQFVKGHRQNPRTWISWGILMSAAGVGLCFFTKQMLWLAVFWGIVFGAGIGISVPLLITELTKDSNQTKVSALLPASPSFGCIVLPFIITVSVSKYGLNGCFLLLAGLILNSIPIIYIAKCKFRFHLPKPIWRLRKRSKRYQMSQKEEGNASVAVYKPKGLQEFYNESFLENLEPDTLQKVSDSDLGSTTKYEFIDILQPIVDAKRKMTTAEICEKKCFEDKINRENDCYKLENHLNNKLSEIITDVQNYEKNRKPFEKSFSHMNVISEDLANATDSITPNKVQCSANESDSTNSLMESSEIPNDDWKEAEKVENIPKNCQDSIPVISATNTTFHVQKSISSHTNQTWNNFPVEIKVHVVECTITTNAEFFEKSFEQNIPSGRKAYRRHSNSLISGCYDNIDFTQLLLNNKATSFQKNQLNSASRMFLITEEDETDFDNKQASFRQGDIEALKEDKCPSKANQTIQKFRILLNPLCMAVIYAFVTYELTLAVLLTMFADFARDTNDFSTSSNIVLVAFGIGGFFGQMSFAHWGNRLMVDGSHAAAAIIFMLNGLAVAGILWSANVCWMSGFYATLGFVESGILLILPRLVTDFVEEKSIVLLSSVCKCLSAISILCMPFAMGLSRDTAGDYDGLLQVISCLSVMCALLCYFLPKLRTKDNSVAK